MADEPEIIEDKSTTKPDPPNNEQRSPWQLIWEAVESELEGSDTPERKKARAEEWGKIKKDITERIDEFIGTEEKTMQSNHSSPPSTVEEKSVETPRNEGVSTVEVNVNDLGYYLDGWAELVENIGAKADEVRSQVVKSLHEREMPDIQVIDERIAFVRITSKEKRKFAFTKTHPGVTTTINVSMFGKDLYVAWATYIKPVINTTTLLIILGLSALCGLIAFSSTSNSLGSSMLFERSAGGLAFSAGFGTFIVVLLLAALGAAIAGRIIKGYSFAYFLIEPTVFDADDITAMSIAAHKSILRSLDGVGFDTKKLRLKQDFKRGRRGELV